MVDECSPLGFASVRSEPCGGGGVRGPPDGVSCFLDYYFVSLAVVGGSIRLFQIYS